MASSLALLNGRTMITGAAILQRDTRNIHFLKSGLDTVTRPNSKCLTASLTRSITSKATLENQAVGGKITYPLSEFLDPLDLDYESIRIME